MEGLSGGVHDDNGRGRGRGGDEGRLFLFGLKQIMLSLDRSQQWQKFGWEMLTDLAWDVTFVMVVWAGECSKVKGNVVGRAEDD